MQNKQPDPKTKKVQSKSKLERIREVYGQNKGTRSLEETVRHLEEIGYPSLAAILAGNGKK